MGQARLTRPATRSCRVPASLVGLVQAATARAVMSRAIVAVEPDDEVSTVVDRMLEYGLRSLPVVDREDGESVLVGMVSRSDLLCCLCLAASRERAGA